MKLYRFHNYENILNESKFNWTFQRILDQFKKDNKDYSERIEKSLKEYLFPNKPGNQIQKLIQELSSEQIEDVKYKLNNILDYFLANNNVDLTINFLKLDQIATDWHNNLESNYIVDRTDETQETTVFIEYPTGSQENPNGFLGHPNGFLGHPGWYWINLNTDYSKDESLNMGHCGRDAGKILLSLRDQYKQSHITVSYSIENKAVYQIKGRNNTKPRPEYHQYIIDMLLNETFIIELMFTGRYKPELDFNILDLTEEQRKDLLDKKPNFKYSDAVLKQYIQNKEWDNIASMINNGFKTDIELSQTFFNYCIDNNILSKEILLTFIRVSILTPGLFNNIPNKNLLNNTIIDNGLYLESLISVPKDFLKNTTINGALSLSSLNSVESDFLKDTVINGSLRLDHLTSIEKGFLSDKVINGSLWLSYLTTVPEDFLINSTIMGDLKFDKLKVLSKNFLENCTINGDLIFNSLKEVDDDFLNNTIINGNLYILNLKSIGENTFKKISVRNNIYVNDVELGYILKSYLDNVIYR